MSAEIDVLAEEYWAYYLQTNPTSAHLLGEYGRAGEFEEATRAAEDAEIAALRAFAQRAEELDETGLDEQQRITRAVVASDATARADIAEARLKELAADPIFGEQVSMPILMGMLAFPDADVANALVDKFRGLGRYYRELAERQREGVAARRFPAAFAVRDTIAQLDAILSSPVADDPLLNTTPPPTGMDVDGWKAGLREAIESDVRPGMAEYRDVLRDLVLPQGRSDEQCGLSWLPDGEEAYAATLRLYTTTTKTAQEIHDIGLAQIAKLADEYRSLGPEVVGTDDLGEIFEAMRTDPKLHFENGEQLVEASEVAMARAWAAMPEWFEVLPQAPCAVQSTMTGAKAFYFPPASDGSRGGTFFVNIADPTAWGTFELEAMAFHEGIPGHHLQIAIASELEDVPEFRKHIHNSAYAEGWGLYTERLSDEMGLYSSSVDRMGMFSADSMRACRLVVDTGLHALGWSRERAVEYMVANSPLAEGVVRPEVDRYIVSPGQATSYMVGRLEIQRMRAEAEQRQGDAFQVKRFHSAVLDSGSLPLGVLDDVVRAKLA
ncbi:DUF885 family protein [Marmoricola sp. URHB0036]|uniref:DUF885 domain-containing protein n=1 Tax=Marmoricola sp. URHB0036 TaxID=1298863 RepID=UPI000423883F|nr:DUF885 domain-containing protein [Marmoricola sp. URHB0036]